MAFKFELRQRVGVPGSAVALTTLMIEALITSRRDCIGRDNRYLLEWKDSSGNDAAVWFNEADIVTANAAACPQCAGVARKRGR